MSRRRFNQSTSEYKSTVLPLDQPVRLHLSNIRARGSVVG
jgi:hypothetical protein